MDHPLVVTDQSDRAPELIREAGALAESAEVPLLVLTVVTQDEFDQDSTVLTTIADQEDTSYAQYPSEYAEHVAGSAVNDILSEFDIETEAIGRGVESDGDRSDVILEVARDHDCDYIFMMGRRRRPTGKAVFGDTAQDVILNFDDYVVTLTE